MKNRPFNKIKILCEQPQNIATKIRYGKLLSDLNGVDIKFYNPETADLKIRGRMKRIEGVTKLLIYSKTDDIGVYEAIETDTANRSGAMYSNIWNLVWSLADPISQEEKDECLLLYKSNIECKC